MDSDVFRATVTDHNRFLAAVPHGRKCQSMIINLCDRQCYNVKFQSVCTYSRMQVNYSAGIGRDHRVFAS